MKINLTAQINEIDRELKLRNDAYEIAISKGKMRRSVADLHLAHMRAVRATLVWLQANEALIKQRLADTGPERDALT